MILALVAAVYLFNAMCTSRQAAPQDVYGQVFAGSAACASCHASICQSHIGTAHYHDSRPASKETIRGSFDSGRNYFLYPSGRGVEMVRYDDGIYQTAFDGIKEYHRERFDITIGSGRKGQSYLYWKEGKLFQLPVSYFTPSDSWCKSPGYTADTPVYGRPVPALCLECHATNAPTVFKGKNEYGDFFDQRQLIYGIDCEKCHGPGARHIEFHTEHPGEKAGEYILNAGRLSRQQKLDACALCHSGSRYPLKPAFSFRVGDRLNDFSQAKYDAENASTLDVHGNQYGLLTSSKCFMQSPMDCSSCHNVHRNEVGETRLFSQKCMNCHNGTSHKTCTMPATAGLVLSDNCIDCHMPALPSQKIVVQLSGRSDTGRTVSNLVRTHRIAVYAEFTRAYLEKIKALPAHGR